MKKFILGMFSLLITVSLFAQEATKQAVTTPAMWKVEAEKPVYLLGTIHMGVEASTEFHKDVWPKLKECKTLVLELDMAKINQFEMMQKMQMPAGKSLDQMLGEEHWKKLGDFIAPVPTMMIRRFKPWALQAIFAQKLLPVTPSVETALTKVAVENAISIEALETVDDQLGAMEKVPEEAMIKSIKNTLDNLPEAKKQAEEMLASYRRGDLEGLHKSMYDTPEAKDMPEMIEHVLVNRNKNWIPKIKEYIKKGNVFIAVGAGHFVGKDGVVALLEAEGYKVTRIEYSK